ncbi:nucleotidyltransferase family protein [Pikeienuella piscinae]|uniref:Nucleotidyltransferase family protein n=1 Tax=Pikeienuella piscinae TaxID=2748098 RepID=A0A7L5C486_9RHOB|nr:nucleotidyltransferase family protein [Pikeienuella piscinae]QIE57124.1 nucleotidyltransferase family protein [Pikeienuella piscinae]
MTGPARAMVLAAGFGTRMGALTAEVPKPLLKVAGRALIDHALDHLAVSGVERAVVNLHYLGGKIREHLAGRTAPQVEFSEETAILETGGGVAQALPLLGPAPFYCVNADAIWTGPAPLPPLAGAWDGGRMGALLLLVARKDAVSHSGPGDFFADSDGRLSRRGAAESAPFVYTGAQIIAPGAFADAPEGAFSTNFIWDRLIREGRLFGVVHSGGWVDVGTPEGLRLAEGMLR